MDTFKVILKPVRHIVITLVLLVIGNSAFADLTEKDFTFAKLEGYGVTKSLLAAKGHTLDSYKRSVLDDVKCLGSRCEYQVKNLRSMNNMLTSICEAATNDTLCMKIRQGGSIRVSRNRQQIIFTHEDPETIKKLKLFTVLFDEVVDFTVHPEVVVSVRIYIIAVENLRRFEFGISGFSGAPDSASNAPDFAADPGQLVGFLGGGASDLFRVQLNAAVGSGKADEVVSQTITIPLGNYFEITRLKNVFRDSNVGSPSEAESGLNFSGVFYPHPEEEGLLWLDASRFYLAFDKTAEGGTVERIGAPTNNRSFVSGKSNFLYAFLSESSVWEKKTGLQFKRNKGSQRVMNIVEITAVVKEDASTKATAKLSAQNFYQGIAVSTFASGRERYINISADAAALADYSGEALNLRVSSKNKSFEANVSVAELLSENGTSLKLPRGYRNQLSIRFQSVEQRRYEEISNTVGVTQFSESWFEAFDVLIGLDRKKEIESIKYQSIYR